MTKTLLYTFTFLACGVLQSANGPSALAQNNSDRDSNQTRSQRQRDERDDRQRGDREQDGRQQVRLPKMLQELDLDSEQEQEIRQAIQQHNRKLQQTWRSFHKAHMQAVNLEAAWTAAVRDTLSESDKQKFDQKRQRHHQKMQRETEGQHENRQAGKDRGQQRTNRRGTDAQQVSSSRDADRQSNSEQSDRQQANRQRSSQQKSDQRHSDSGNQSEESEGFYVVTITSPLIYTTGSRQSSQQKQQCSKACQKYTQQVRNSWQKATKLHNRLVQLEADKIEAIEEVLTNDQLASLKDQRREPQTDQERETEESYSNR